MNNKDSSTIYFLAGLLLGGLVGAGVGLLVAPESGEQTRAKLKKQGEKVIKNSMKTWQEFEKTQLKPAIDKATEDIKDKVEDLKKDFSGQQKPKPRKKY